MLAIRTLYFLLAVAFAPLVRAQFEYKSTKSLFDLACATLCQDHTGDPIDVSGEEFSDLVSLYLDGNFTDGNSTDSNTTQSDVAIIYGDIECWDVSAVTDMSGAFAFQEDFDREIACWDVSSVTDMSSMFLEATSFNEDLNQWAQKVPRGSIVLEDMFLGSGCDVTDDPDTMGRPWCQFRRPEWSPEFSCFFFKKC